jgi:hypothetical protein
MMGIGTGILKNSTGTGSSVTKTASTVAGQRSQLYYVGVSIAGVSDH